MVLDADRAGGRETEKGQGEELESIARVRKRPPVDQEDRREHDERECYLEKQVVLQFQR